MRTSKRKSVLKPVVQAIERAQADIRRLKPADPVAKVDLRLKVKKLDLLKQEVMAVCKYNFQVKG